MRAQLHDRQPLTARPIFMRRNRRSAREAVYRVSAQMDLEQPQGV
jgi:hypothetical protein